MKITKEELAKIKKFRKVLESVFTLDEINELNIGLRITEDLFIVATKTEDYFFQCKLNIENGEDLKLSTTLGELLKVVEEFTKKAEIDISLDDCCLKFSGLQDKETKNINLPIKYDNLISPKDLPKTNTMMSLNLLSGLLACHKMATRLNFVEVESYIKFSVKNNKLRVFANGQCQLVVLNYDYTGNDCSFFIEKDKVKALYTLIQETKSFEINISLTNKTIILESGYISAIIKRTERPALDLEQYVDFIENNLNFQETNVIIDEESIMAKSEDKKLTYLSNDYLKADSIKNVFSDISIINAGYTDTRISSLLKIKSIEDLKVFKGDKDVLKLANDYLAYYLLPEKKTN